MLKDITIGQYVKGDSILHRLDPRTKIFGMLAIMVALFFVNNWIGLVYAAIVVFAVLFASQVPLKFYIRGVKPLRWILLFTAAIQIFLTPGEIIWQWGILHITAEGVRLAIFMCVRLVLLVMTTSVLTLTTTPIVLTDAVENLLSPFKRIGVPAHELAMMMTIALRFIPLLADETEKIMAAQKARGAALTKVGSWIARGRFCRSSCRSFFRRSIVPASWRWPWKRAVTTVAKGARVCTSCIMKTATVSQAFLLR